MIPVLFPADEAVKGASAFNTGGYGGLVDAISCVVTEELNGAFELEMEYPITGRHYSDIKIDRLIYTKVNETSDFQIFRIYAIDNPLNGVATIHGEHISYLLSKTMVFPFECESAQTAFVHISDLALFRGNNGSFPVFPFTFWTDAKATGEIKVESPKSIKSVLYDEVINGLYNKADYEFDNFSVKLHDYRGKRNANVTLRYGKNITDLTRERDSTDSFTGIVPYWKGSLKEYKIDDGEQDGGDRKVVSESVEQTIYIDEDKGGRIVWDPVNSHEYEYPMLMAMDFSSNIDAGELEDDDPTNEDDYKYDGENIDLTDLRDAHNAFEAEVKNTIQQDLVRLSNEYFTNNVMTRLAKETITVSFVQLWNTEEYKDYAQLESVSLGDAVSIYYPQIDLAVSRRVIKTEFNVLLDRYNSIDIGEKEEVTGVGTGSTSVAATIDKMMHQTTDEVFENGARKIFVGVKDVVNVKTTDAYIRARDESLKRAKEFAEKTVFVNSKAYTDEAAEQAKEAWEKFGSNDKAADLTEEWKYIKAAKEKYEQSDQKITGLDQKTTGLDQTVTGLDQKITGLDQRLTATDQAVTKAKNDAIDAAKTYVKEKDDYLTQTKVFNKLTNNGTVKGIVMNGDQLYFNADYIHSGKISADYISGGTLDAKVLAVGSIISNQLSTKDGEKITASNIADGAIGTLQIDKDAVTAPKIKAGEIKVSGHIDAESVTAQWFDTAYAHIGGLNADWITTGILTGVTIQTAEPADSHLRIVMASDSTSIRGVFRNKNGEDLVASVIDFGQAGSSTNNLVIDARNALHIRTPNISISTVSYGTGGGTVKQTSKSEDIQFVTDVEKDFTDTSEVTVGGVYCTLPVFLKVYWDQRQIRHGFIMNEHGAGYWSDPI